MLKAAIFLQEWNEFHIQEYASDKPVQYCSKWHVPGAGFVKANVDASFSGESVKTSIGMLLRDEIGHMLAGRTMWKPGIMKVDEGEAWGLWEAVCWVRSLGYNRVVIEVDAKRVTDAIKSEEDMNTPFGNYIVMIKNLINI